MLLLDDLHWADADTLSVLESMGDSLDTLRLALDRVSRPDRAIGASAVHEFGTQPAIRYMPLRRLTPVEVEGALRALRVPLLEIAQLDRIVAMVDGLPLVLEECVRQIRETGSQGREVDLTHSSLASAVRLRLDRLSNDSRLVVDALSIIGDAEPRVLSAATGLDPYRLASALHAWRALSSSVRRRRSASPGDTS